MTLTHSTVLRITRFLKIPSSAPDPTSSSVSSDGNLLTAHAGCLGQNLGLDRYSYFRLATRLPRSYSDLGSLPSIGWVDSRLPTGTHCSPIPCHDDFSALQRPLPRLGSRWPTRESPGVPATNCNDVPKLPLRNHTRPRSSPSLAPDTSSPMGAG